MGQRLLLVGCLTALLDMNGREHVADLANPSRRDVAEDVPVKMYHAALVARLRQKIRDALDKAPAGVGNDQLHAFEAACRPAGFVFLGALPDPQDLAKSFRIDSRGHQQRNVADLAGPRRYWMRKPIGCAVQAVMNEAKAGRTPGLAATTARCTLWRVK